MLACNTGLANPDREFDSREDELLYFMGTQLGQELHAIGVTDKKRLKLVQQGLLDRARNKAPRFDDGYPSMLSNWMALEYKKTVDAEKERAAQYLAEQSARQGATTSEDGLVYVPIIEGEGEQPNKGSNVTAHYVTSLSDGTVIDSTFDRGAPLQARLTQVIKCWSRGIQMMRVGGKARISCPSELTYGDRGTATIPGGAALTFEVELLDVESAVSAKAEETGVQRESGQAPPSNQPAG